MDAILQKAVELGATEARPIDPVNVVVANWVRLKCQYGCSGWGRRLTCPPFSPTPEETSKVLSEYKSAVLVHRAGPWSEFRKTMSELERFAFLDGYHKAFSYHSGPCNLCEECDVNGPCKHPREARPSMEACGIDVFGTATAAGMPIRVVKTRNDETNYYGLLLLE